MTYIVRTLSEDAEIESEEVLADDNEDQALQSYNVVCRYTFDTESLFYPGDPFWTVQLIDNDDDRVIVETNSVNESLGLFERSFDA